MKLRILVFGDSVAYGAWDEMGGWVDRLKSVLHKKYMDFSDSKCQVYNLGVGGDTSDTLYSRMESECVKRKSSEWPVAIVVACGINDVRTIAATGVRQVDIGLFEENMQLIVDLAKKHAEFDEETETRKVIVVGLTQVQHARTTFKRFTYDKKDVSTYNAVLKKIAESSGVTFCELDSFNTSANMPQSSVFHSDGLHPNAKGHQLILADVYKKIEEIFRV